MEPFADIDSMLDKTEMRQSDMASTDDTLKARLQLEKTIDLQRKQLLQAHGALTCLYQVLLHGEGEESSLLRAGDIRRGQPH